MKTVYLHIGTHKTGTTSLQTILSANQDKLRSFGYYYPKSATCADRFTPGHHLLCWAITLDDYKEYEEWTGEPVDLQTAWPNTLKEMNKANEHSFIISSEYFWLLSEDQIQTLKEHLSNYNVKINICLRRQDQFLMSLYSERVKKGSAKGFKEFIEEFRDFCIYSQYINRWEKVFGQNNITVRAYKKGKDSVNDFLNHIGLSELDADHLKLSDRKFNASLSGKSLRIIRWLNFLHVKMLSLPLPYCKKLYLRPLQTHKGRKAVSLIPNFLISNQIMSETLSRAIMLEFESVNSEIARKYLPGNTLFKATSP